MDLFDLSGVPIIVEGYLGNPSSKEWGVRLEFMASIRMFDEFPGLSSEADCNPR